VIEVQACQIGIRGSKRCATPSASLTSSSTIHWRVCSPLAPGTPPAFTHCLSRNTACTFSHVTCHIDETNRVGAFGVIIQGPKSMENGKSNDEGSGQPLGSDRRSVEENI